MKVLLVSKFLHHVGGVETYVRWLASSLAEAGHSVALVGMQPDEGHRQMDFNGATVYETPPRHYVGRSLAHRSVSALTSVYSRATAAVMRQALEDFAPDVVHFHGTCYQLTSSVVRATEGLGLRRIATAHEYKLACANQRLWSDREKAICTLCVGATRLGRLTNPIRQSCIKGSTLASSIGGVEAVIADMVWRRADDLTIHTPSRFMADVLLADGWNQDRLRTIDLPWPDTSDGPAEGGRDFLYMGRLAVEKDVSTLLAGWSQARDLTRDRRLVIAGDGASRPSLEAQVAQHDIPRVDFMGRLGAAQLRSRLNDSTATVHSAAWYENSPFSVRESLMAGVPAIVADIGGMPELIRDGVTGQRVEHTVAGWAGAFARYDDTGLRPGEAVLSAVLDYRMSERDHITALLDMYERGA